MTTQEKIDSLCRDFLQRNGRNFTSVRRSGRIGWESVLPRGAAYSEAVLRVNDRAELHKVAYSHARDMIVAMNIPFRVRISLTGKCSCTDSRTVFVATEMFDDGKLSPGEAVDIFTGLAVHEGCHLLYTDFSVIGMAGNRIVADLSNLIEDERIEMLCGEERPGLSNFLACTKYYYFDRHSSRHIDPPAGCRQERTYRLFNSILALIRYPGALDMDDVAEFVDILLKVREIVVPYPRTTAETLEAAEKIYSIIWDFYEQEKDQGEVGDAPGNGGGQETGAGPAPRRRGRTVEREMSDCLDGILSSLEKSFSGNSCDGSYALDPSMMSCTVREDGCRFGRALSGEIEIGVQDGVNICLPEPSKELYEDSLERVRRFIPAMANALRGNGADRRAEIRGLRSGMLDTGRLAEAVQGVENIYRMETVSRADRLAVCVLVDESGSMYGEKMQSARDAAVLLNEALSSVRNVDLFIYGHTTEGRSFVKLKAYREGRKPADRYALGGIGADDCNVDSLAIREAACRVRAATREKCLFFVISDGAPCEPPQNVRKAVRELSKSGFTFVSIGIDFISEAGMMYDNHVSMTDMTRFAPELGKLIKKAIMTTQR